MNKIFYASLLVIFGTACNTKQEKSDAYGTFETTEITVSSESAGKIIFSKIEEGITLSQNEKVMIIDTTDLVLRKNQLQAQIEAIGSKDANIKAQIDVQLQQIQNINVDKNRIERLIKDGAATPKQLDDINASLSMVNKQIEAIRSQEVSIASEKNVVETQIAQIDEQISKCYISNPINGSVLVKYAEASEYITPGKPLYKIADLSTMTLKVYVSGDQLPSIKIGQKVLVYIDKDKSNNQKMEGDISWISSTAEFTPKIIQTKEERVNLVYAVKVRVKNDGTLKIGMPGEIMFSNK